MSLLKKLLSVLLCAIMVFSILPLCNIEVDAASAYPKIEALKVPRIYQPLNDTIGYCHFNSIACIIAYKKGSYTYGDLSKTYSYGTDYSQTSDPVWKKMLDSSENWVDPIKYHSKGYPYYVGYPGNIVTEEVSGNSTQTYKIIYEQLSKGNPVVVYGTGKYNHASVVIGYSADTNSLDASKFCVMEISLGTDKVLWPNSKSLFDKYANAPNSNDGTSCYLTLSHWLKKQGINLTRLTYYKDPSVEIDKSYSKYSISETNAVLCGKVANPKLKALGNCGIKLYDVSGNLLKECKESISNLSSYSVVNLYYDVNDELKYTLKKGTTYKYQLWAVINGTTYYSPIETFTTKGDNILSVYYNANGGSIDSDTYYLSSDNIYKSSDNTKHCQKWTYNEPQQYGLYDASTFGLYKKGYEFVGWSTTPEGTLWYDQKDNIILPTDLNSNIKNGDCSVTMYAVWAKSNDFFDSIFANSFSTNGAYVGANIASEEYDSLKLNIGISEDNVTHIIDCPPPFSENQIYFNIAEHGLMLEPSTTYCYSFTAVIDGDTYESEKGYFTTLAANGYFTDIYTTDVTEDNAVIVADLVRTNIEEYGIYLTPYGEETHRYSCDYVADTEELSLSIKEYADFALEPNRTYLYRFFIVENSTEWISEEYEFCTAPLSNYFIDVRTETTTQYNAVIYADIYDVAVDSAGFYIGKSEDDLTKVVTIQERENTSVICYEFCYSITDYYEHLDPDTEYCYKFYFVINGVEHTSVVRSFRTQEEEIFQPEDDDTISIEINALSDTVMDCGETVTLSAATTGNLPEETSIVWEVSNDNFELIIHPWFDTMAMLEAKTVGSTTVTAKIVDESGDVIDQDELIVFVEYNSEKPDEKYLEIRNPSTASINYGDSIKLHADLNGELPDGWYVEWTSDNENFNIDVSEKGAVCTISPASSGDTVFTATVYDENDNVVCSYTQVMTSNAGFFHKIIGFFKGLFGLTKDYEW